MKKFFALFVILALALAAVPALAETLDAADEVTTPFEVPNEGCAVIRMVDSSCSGCTIIIQHSLTSGGTYTPTGDSYEDGEFDQMVAFPWAPTGYLQAKMTGRSSGSVAVTWSKANN